MSVKRSFWLIWLGVGLCHAAGCAVPQPRGGGHYERVREPTTKAWYRLYLPVDYVRNNGRHPDPKVKKWPLVMTFHGMTPYDTASAQEKEWEQEADVYGYIVCAPELRTSSSFMEYPLTKEHSYVLHDKRNVLAIMDHLIAKYGADPERVLSTSWSCGGYLAHYFPNRFPNRFRCIATRLSNFSEKLMIEETVPLYRDRIPVAIFIGDGDFPKCKSESQNAVAWYRARNFRVVRGKVIDHMGHRRIPQVAAAFFAEQLGIEPLDPVKAAETVRQVQMTDYNPPPELLAKMSPRRRGPALAASGSKRAGGKRALLPPLIERRKRVAFASKTAGYKYPVGRVPAYDPTPEAQRMRSPMRSPIVRDRPRDSGATRLAMNRRKEANWLSPTGRPSDRGSPAAKPSGAKPSRAKSPGASERRRAGTPGDAKIAPTTKRKTTRRFTPRDAGPRDYRRLVRKGATRRATPLAGKGPEKGRSTAALRRGSVRPVVPRSGRMAKRVKVRLSGPAIGTAPHYIAYSADLRPSLFDGADCLWMDNGVWMSDEPRGVKILDSPGLHQITVLIVSKDNVEYRGSATVRVLEAEPLSSARHLKSY